jgi:hypothetical protein
MHPRHKVLTPRQSGERDLNGTARNGDRTTTNSARSNDGCVSAPPVQKEFARATKNIRLHDNAHAQIRYRPIDGAVAPINADDTWPRVRGCVRCSSTGDQQNSAVLLREELKTNAGAVPARVRESKP